MYFVNGNHLNFSSDGSGKNASQSALHTMKPCGSSTRHMLKQRGIVVLLMCKLEALYFQKKNQFTSISTWLLFKRTLSLMKSKLLCKRVKSPEILPVLKYLLYPKSMFSSNYLPFSFSPALYCSKHKHNACLKL